MPFSVSKENIKNVTLVEQANTDFAFVIVRQYLYDAFHLPLLESLSQSKDDQIAAIAAKSIKEVKYHHRFSSTWVKRLGDGTQESHDKVQNALNEMYPLVGEFFRPTEYENQMLEAGIGADLGIIKSIFDSDVENTMNEATLVIPDAKMRTLDGKNGLHTEKLGFILSDLQYMQRAYPNMEW